MGWHEQGDGKLMLGINVEQGRIRDTPGLTIKTALRQLVDKYDLPMILTPSQSIVLRNIDPKDRYDVESLLTSHGVKQLHQIDAITRKSMACPAFPLCGLAMAEAERVQPETNARLSALLAKMGLAELDFVTRTTGCPNGCARPYMAELALVGSGPNTYQLWLGGDPNQSERTGYPTDIFKMKYDALEETLEPIFAMYKSQRNAADEAFGNFCHRVGWPAIKEFIEGYSPGGYASLPDPYALPRLDAPDASAPLSSALLEQLTAEAGKRGLDVHTLLDTIVREALEG